MLGHEHRLLNRTAIMKVRISEEIARAIDQRQPVVALESTVIAHGLPYPQNLETAVKNHGALAGVNTPQDVAEYKDWLQHKNMFMTEWDHKSVDAQWQFLEVARRTGILDKVPDKNKYALFVQS